MQRTAWFAGITAGGISAITALVVIGALLLQGIQLGVAPGLTLFEKMEYPVTLSFPIAVSLSLYDYYEFGTGDDDTFGAFSAGMKASVPLKFIPAAFGNWQARASVLWYHFGDNLTTVNRGDRDAVVGLLGISLSY